jgi:hypothetical protein
MLFVTCLFTYFFTYSLTPRSTVLLEKLTGSQLVQIFPAFYETWKFIAAFKRARHLSSSWATSIKSMPLHYRSTSSRYILISSHLHLGLPSGLFPLGFPTKTMHARFLSYIRATCPAQLIQYFRSLSSSNCRTWKEEHSLDLGMFHNFFRPRRPLGRVEVKL